MKRSFYLAFFALLVLLPILASCASGKSLVEPKNEDSLLFIGQIEFTGFGHSSGSLNGVHSRYITFVFLDEDEQELRIQANRKDGLFFTNRWNYGMHRLVRIEYAVDQSQFAHGCSSDAGMGNFFINYRVVQQKINNVGKIRWSWDAVSGISQIRYIGEQDQVLQMFVDAYPETGWLDFMTEYL